MKYLLLSIFLFFSCGTTSNERPLTEEEKTYIRQAINNGEQQQIRLMAKEQLTGESNADKISSIDSTLNELQKILEKGTVQKGIEPLVPSNN